MLKLWEIDSPESCNVIAEDEGQAIDIAFSELEWTWEDFGQESRDVWDIDPHEIFDLVKIRELRPTHSLRIDFDELPEALVPFADSYADGDLMARVHMTAAQWVEYYGEARLLCAERFAE